MGFIIIILLVLGVLLYARNNGNPDSLEGRHITEAKHGHRCYIDGLSPAEKEVVSVLAHGLSPKDYFIFNNLILPSSNNGSTQIDHLVVSRFGIFVIESKNFNGWIFGSQEGTVWTQCLPRGYKFTFQNPIRQNYAHIMALKALMPFVGTSFFSLVVFSDTCEFKTPRISDVLFLSELIENIKERNQELLDEQTLLMSIGKLSYLCQAVDITSSEHVLNVQKSIAERKQ